MIERKLRMSQTLVPFGVGGIYDVQGESLIGCDIYRWGSSKGDVVHSPRLTEALGVNQLRSAPAVESNAFGGTPRSIPYARFPSWLFCNKCRRMVKWTRSMEQEDKRPRCPSCVGRQPLAPMRWVQICPRGHIDDVDWWWWCHHDQTAPDQRQCGQRNRLEFAAQSSLGSAGLGSLSIHCLTCNARRALGTLLSPDAARRASLRCSGRQPWQWHGDAVECTEQVKVVQRGASNVYYPTVASSMEIPRPSSIVTPETLVVQNDPLFEAALGTEPGSVVEVFAIGQLARTAGIDEATVRQLIADERRRRDGFESVVDASPGDLLGEEWAAFITPTDDPDHPDFVTRHVGLIEGDQGTETSPLSLANDRISRVVVADRLREVRALQGFNRVTPTVATMVPVDLGRKVGWLPAIEVRGEGIFLSLDEARLADWEHLPAVTARVQRIEDRMHHSFQRERLERQTGPRLLPRYPLLHTLAHVLIRRLAFETGYSATSLRERIYGKSSIDPDHPNQAGILIYTAAADSEGTLGGLVRQGEPPRFAETLLECLTEASWCSSDPLCAESEATSFDSLNLAACHACCLISETSCEAGNFLLDRTLVVGPDLGLGFFAAVVEASLHDAVEMTE